MVLRAWRCFAAAAQADEYPRHLLDTVRPKLALIPGFRGLYLLSRAEEAEVEYCVHTLWDSMEAIRAFAGATPQRAVVESEAAAALVRYDAEVVHYEVIAAPEA